MKVLPLREFSSLWIANKVHSRVSVFSFHLVITSQRHEAERTGINFLKGRPKLEMMTTGMRKGANYPWKALLINALVTWDVTTCGNKQMRVALVYNRGQKNTKL